MDKQAPGKRVNNIQYRFMDHVRAPQQFSVIFKAEPGLVIMQDM